MNQEILADHAVRITQVIKDTRFLGDGNQTISHILDTIPELGAVDLTMYLHSMYKQLNTDKVMSNKEIVEAIQAEASDPEISDIKYNTIWQNIAQGIYYVASVLVGLLPPKWASVITIILNAYLAFKGEV